MLFSRRVINFGPLKKPRPLHSLFKKSFFLLILAAQTLAPSFIEDRAFSSFFKKTFSLIHFFNLFLPFFLSSISPKIFILFPHFILSSLYSIFIFLCFQSPFFIPLIPFSPKTFIVSGSPSSFLFPLFTNISLTK